MKKKFGLMIVAGLLILGTVIGGTLAGMTARTERMAVAQIATKTLHVGLNDGMKGQTASETENLVMEPMVPGDEKEALSTVTNTGDYPVYVRVWVTRYFLEKTEGRM